MSPTLESIADANTREGELYEPLSENRLRCFACGHRCVIFDGKRGICKVRFNRAGKLQAPYGYVASLQCDPTEKKPYFHVLPGSLALTFGMLGFSSGWLLRRRYGPAVYQIQGIMQSPRRAILLLPLLPLDHAHRSAHSGR